jgi:hypothetical protein
MAAPRPVTRGGLDTGALDPDFRRADLEFAGLDHSGPSFEGRVFVNNAEADATTARTADAGYAGTFHVFGHGGCLGEPGHCEVSPRRLYDPRPAHPLTPGRKVVIATEAVRRAVADGGPLTVTVVPVVRSVTPKAPAREDVLRFGAVRVVTYR